MWLSRGEIADAFWGGDQLLQRYEKTRAETDKRIAPLLQDLVRQQKGMSDSQVDTWRLLIS